MRKQKIDAILYFLSSILVILIVINVTKFTLLAGGDNVWFINPQFVNRLFVWANFDRGIYFQNADFIPVDIFFRIFKLAGLHNEIIQTLYYVFFYLGAYLTFLFVITKLFRPRNALSAITASLLYVFNAFNLISPFQDRTFPVFIALPLLFYCYYKLLHNRSLKYILYIPLISLVYSGSNINPAVVSIIFIVFFLYLIYFLITVRINKREFIELLGMHALLITLYCLVNLWWLSTFFQSMFQTASIGAQVYSFRATTAGFLYDHFRLLGQWGWYAGHYLSMYFPYSVNYYKPLMLLSTFGITVIALLHTFIIAKATDADSNKKLYEYFLILFVFSLFLANGYKAPLGYIFEIIYNSNKLLWIFREPFAKFTPLMVFAIPFLLFGTLDNMRFKKNSLTKYYAVCALVICCIFLSVYPYINGEIVWTRWNGTMRDNRVIIPEYYDQLANYLRDNNLENESILIFPRNYIYTAFNWQHGLFASINPATLLLKNPTIKATSLPLYDSNIVINQIFDNLANPNFDMTKYLNLLGARYVLQQNDADWRYFGAKVMKPSVSNAILVKNGLSKVESFGNFTKEYLAEIPNGEPDTKLRDELGLELIDKPALILYKINELQFLPQIYVPQQLITSAGNLESLPKIVSSKEYRIRSAIFLQSQNIDNQKGFGKLTEITQNYSKQSAQPTIEFKKIDLTKYRIRVHSAANTFPLVFSENYNTEWKIYLIKSQVQTASETQITDKSYNINTTNDQATYAEIQTYISNGWITTPTNNIYLSKKRQGAIQNDNLPNNKFFETWNIPFGNNRVLRLPDYNHLKVNGYANAWLIDTNAMCIKLNAGLCSKNSDGTYDFELIIEFKPQNTYRTSIFISVTTVVLILGGFLGMRARSNARR